MNFITILSRPTSPSVGRGESSMKRGRPPKASVALLPGQKRAEEEEGEEEGEVDRSGDEIPAPKRQKTQRRVPDSSDSD